MSDAINWAELRRRIALTPVVVPPQRPKYYERSPEALEKHRRSARERQRVRYQENKEYELARVRAWEKEHPDKVRENRRNSYARRKLDPEWMERKRERDREYKARKRERDKAQKAVANVA